MKSRIKYTFLFILIVTSILICLYCIKLIPHINYSIPANQSTSINAQNQLKPDNMENAFHSKSIKFGSPKADSIKIAITNCGNDLIFTEQILVMIKSALMFTKSELHFIIVIDEYRITYVDEV